MIEERKMSDQNIPAQEEPAPTVSAEASAAETVTSPAIPAKPEQPPWPKLPIRGFATMTPEEYIDERLNSSIAWYDKAASTSKSRYLNFKAATVIGGAIVPVLVNIDVIPYINIVTTVISLIVVLLVSLESVYHYREQWTNYRSTEQNLRNEYFVFVTKDGPYAGIKKEEAFLQFVLRIENTIEAENSSTLQVLTTVTDAKIRQFTQPAQTPRSNGQPQQG
jgi:hypothetical protein